MYLKLLLILQFCLIQKHIPHCSKKLSIVGYILLSFYKELLETELSNMNEADWEYLINAALYEVDTNVAFNKISVSLSLSNIWMRWIGNL